MCFCFPFAPSNNKKRKSSSSAEKKRREKPPSDPLRGNGAVVAEVQEVRRSTERPKKKKSRESPRREREEDRQQHYRANDDVYRSRSQYRAPLHLDVPTMWHRSIDPESTGSSEEMLLNPRPHRSPHHRQRHSKQTTLRGHGAKREKSKKDLSHRSRGDSSSQAFGRSRGDSGGWSFFAPSTPPRTPKKRDHSTYKNLDSSPRSHRSPRQQRSTHHYREPSPSRSQPRHHRSRQQQQPSSRTRQATPNTSVRRDPDRRFAVLAATNTALEDLRREAFAQPSPPPRRERLRRYQGVTIPASSIPYSWDCISSSQTSAGYAESSTRQRRRR